jgi:hypothetical protein
VIVEVSGCPTTCTHCWALGRGYRAMPIGDAAFFLDELSGFCRERRLGYTAYPVHEVTAHPAAPDIIRLFARTLARATTRSLPRGTPLASREDWAEIIAAAKECGAHALWVAFHGYDNEHNRQLNRPGAFEETCLAVRRARECGIGSGARVFLTKPGLRDFDRLLSVLQRNRAEHGGDGLVPAAGVTGPGGRSRSGHAARHIRPRQPARPPAAGRRPR